MRIYLPDVKAKSGEAVTYSFEEKLSSCFDDFLEGDELKLNLSASSSGDKVIITGTLEASIEADCSRCLERFRQVIRSDFSEAFTVLSHSTAEADPRLLAAETAENLTVRGDYLYIDEFIRQLIILAQAYNPLCRPECRGLCAGCGEDLNTNKCRCPQDGEPVDERLRKLKDFKTGS